MGFPSKVYSVRSKPPKLDFCYDRSKKPTALGCYLRYRNGCAIGGSIKTRRIGRS